MQVITEVVTYIVGLFRIIYVTLYWNMVTETGVSGYADCWISIINKTFYL